MKLYNTVLRTAEAEQIIERSRFISHVSPVESKEEADAFIAEVRKEHRDATHNVPAMVVGSRFEIQWGSDDGEPQGTSGAPIVQMLVNQEMTNLVIVVTRYFGGIKLGTGGLVRAYTSSAKLGLEAAVPCAVEEVDVLSYEVDYSSFNRIQNYDFAGQAHLDSISYTDRVAFDIITGDQYKNSCKELISGFTNGQAILKNERKDLKKIPL